VAWLVKAVLTDEERRSLRWIAEELKVIRRQIEELSEKLVTLSDKELMKSFNTDQIDLKENEVLRSQEKLQAQLDSVEKDLG
jgi:hypothetical protein